MAAKLPTTISSSGSFEQLQPATDYLNGSTTLANLAGGRLTLSSGVPVTSSDVTSTTPAIYYTPYLHDRIALYDGSSTWTTYQFAELVHDTGALLTATAGETWDVFVWNASGTIVVGVSNGQWTNSTTRANALTMINGVLVNSADTTQRYVGTVYLFADNTLSDTVVQRGVWNYNNRVIRGMSKSNSTSHTYGTGTYREWNGGTAETLQFVTGLNEDELQVNLIADSDLGAKGLTFTSYTGIGFDSITTPNFNIGQVQTGNTLAATRFALGGSLSLPPSAIGTIGNHTLACLEFGSGGSGGTSTFHSYTMSSSLPM